MSKSSPKILLYDIENMAAKVYTWSNYQTDVIATAEDWYLLSVAWKWLGEEKVSFARKSKRKGDDRELVEQLWHLFDEADVLVAHNGDAFDQRKATARFIELGFGPPSPYLTIDTKKVMSRVAMNYSNKLDEIARRLDIGRKLDTLGFSTWLGCANEDPAAWKLMRKYNIHDVELLEEVYLALRPWVETVNMAHWTEGLACKKCGSARVTKRGVRRTNASLFQTYQCKDCGGYSRAPKAMGKAGVR